MRLNWVNNGFICKELYAPFVVENDNDYYDDLLSKFNLVLRQAKNAGADEDSIKIIARFKNKILEALRSYYRADIAKCNTIIRNLIIDLDDDPLAINALESSYAFSGNANEELQFFRSRTANPSNGLKVKDMLHLPHELRSKTGNYRFSIPGNPSIYFSNSSYGCWIESEFPADIDFNVSPALVDGSIKVLNLAVSIKDFSNLNELKEKKVHTWIKLLMLKIATSYKIKETDRIFKSEYVISQSIMMACKKLEYDGVAYYSSKVEDEAFARCAINLALFVNYKGEYAYIINNIKMDAPFNYSIYKNLLPSLNYRTYPLRSTRTGFIVKIGDYDSQFPYSETEFYQFDQFLFANWERKEGKKGKDGMPWGGMLSE